MSLNLHAVGLHFVGSITGIEEIPVVNPTPPEREEQPLTDTRFRASIRGWTNHAHQHRAQTLLDMRDEQMVATLQRDKDIILIPRDWWKDKAESLEPEDLGWWYTVNKVIKLNPSRQVGREREGRETTYDKENTDTGSEATRTTTQITKSPIQFLR